MGFTLAGITTPDPPPHFSSYENWLSLGRYGSMGYMAGERARIRRSDPRLILPECRSILMLAVRYPDPKTARPDPQAGCTGRVAAYAWGRDYHLVLPERLKTLGRFIENLSGSAVAQRWYSDTGPILERDLAQRAGLGWTGKNTCLIHPTAGSYFLLAEILLGIELEPDQPFTADRCGNCRRCMEACPTGCILPDRTLDARRCISTLTIENKAEIPVELRPQMGNWIFGCDICQMVCPWNRFASEEYDQGLAPDPRMAYPNLRAGMRLTPQEFNRKFQASPIRRTRHSGYLRNVAVAMGNSRNLAFLLDLEEARQNAEPLVQQHVEWAIQQLRAN